MAAFSVDLDDTHVKNTHARSGRNRTTNPKRSETPDRRVSRTKRALREALVGLAREKPYDAIAVKEILTRANVGRSTFYTHFADKDDLLGSGVHEMLVAIHRRPRSGDVLERIVAFARPLLEHIDAHRRTPGPQMVPESRAAMHSHLQDVLVDMIQEDVAAVV